MDRIKKLKFASNYGKDRLLCWIGPGEKKPWNVVVSPTLSCNLRCRQCSLWKQEGTKELDANAWKEILDETISWLGSCYITITGGEPLLKKKAVMEIIGFASKRGIMTKLITNGACLSDGVLRELGAAGLGMLSISLDGKAETHDRLRGMRGLHKRISLAMESINEGKINLKTTINTTIMKPNLDELADLVAWSGLNSTAIRFQALVQNFGETPDPSWFRRSALWPPDAKKTLSVIDNLISMKIKGYPVGNPVKQMMAFKQYYSNPIKVCRTFVCGAGQNISINPDGWVNICPAMEPVGRIDKDGAKTIWRSGKSRLMRRNILECRDSCKMLNCNFDDGLKERISRLFNL